VIGSYRPRVDPRFTSHNSGARFDGVQYMRDTDEALLQSGDLEDFGVFYDRYVRTLLAFFQRRTGNPEIAADLTAETFAAAMVARKRFRPREAGAAAWLFTIAHHKLSDYRRRGRAEGRMRERLGMEPVPVGSEDAELIRWLGEEVAVQIIEELPVEQREAVRAHVLEDRGYAEIARDERVAEATVRKRVSRGLRLLRDRVGGNL
jgi:RNA polymerase sigma-70 factor (ECF subfamily)